MGYGRKNATISRTSEIVDHSVIRAMSFHPWYIVPARSALRLRRGVHRLDSNWISRSGVGVARRRVASECSDPNAHDRVTSKHVREAASVTVACRKYSSGIYAKVLSQIRQQRADKADIIHVVVSPGRRPGRVRLEA